MASTTTDVRVVEDRKPLMTGQQILLMNVGFFGIQYSFGMQRAAEVAASSEAKLVVVSAYKPVAGRDQAKAVASIGAVHEEVRGEDNARAALKDSGRGSTPPASRSSSSARCPASPPTC